MNREQLYELMEDGNLGYACVYEKSGQGISIDYMFKMTAENIANFIDRNAYRAEKIVMTDMCDKLICEVDSGGIITKCPNLDLLGGINSRLANIKEEGVELGDFLLATREEMEALWNSEEEAVMQGEFRML